MKLNYFQVVTFLIIGVMYFSATSTISVVRRKENEGLLI